MSRKQILLPVGAVFRPAVSSHSAMTSCDGQVPAAVVVGGWDRGSRARDPV